MHRICNYEQLCNYKQFPSKKTTKKKPNKSPTFPNKGKNHSFINCCMGNYSFVPLLCCCISEVLIHLCVLLAKFEVQNPRRMAME